MVRIAMDSPNAQQVGITVARRPRKKETETTVQARMVVIMEEMAVHLARALAMGHRTTLGSSQVISSLMSRSDR